MRDGGKGDKPRPYSIPLEEFDNRWDTIFKKKDKPEDKSNNKDQDEKPKTS
jgi:hypothetical protein